jgi:hypothetical protein
MAIDGATEMTKKMKQAIEYARRVEFDRGWRAGVDHEYARLNELERCRACMGDYFELIRQRKSRSM